jgi:cell division protein FtsZ
MGCGIASGENRAIEAAQKAISSPLLEGINIKGAKSVLLNVTGSSNLTIQEVNEGNNVIFEAAGEEANVIFGCVQKEEMNDNVSYTVIATGFDGSTRSFSTKASKSIKQKQKEPDVFAGKFNFGNDPAEIDTTDLEVPTIYRVKKPQSQLELNNDEEESINSGFVFNTNKLNWSKEKTLKDNEQQKVSEEDDSSSFLRMIMD